MKTTERILRFKTMYSIDVKFKKGLSYLGLKIGLIFFILLRKKYSSKQ